MYYTHIASSFSSSYTGLREMADLVNRDVTLWFRADYANLSFAFTGHDFVLSTDMVRVAIDRNLGLG